MFYTIRGLSFWQVIQDLPAQLDAALNKRYEAVRVRMSVTLLAIAGLLFIASIAASQALELNVLVGLVVGGVLFAGAFLAALSVFELKTRHQKTLDELVSGSRWQDCLIGPRSIVYQAIMAPQLEEYFKCGGSIFDSGELAKVFDLYLLEVEYARQALRLELDEHASEDVTSLKLVYDFRCEVVAIAESFSSELSRLLGISFGTYFVRMRQSFKRDYRTALLTIINGESADKTDVIAMLHEH